MLSLRTVAGRDEKTTAALCADAHEFSLHAGVRCGAHQRKELERLCRYITRPAIANERQLWRKSTVSNGSEAIVAQRRPLAKSCRSWLHFNLTTNGVPHPPAGKGSLDCWLLVIANRQGRVRTGEC